MKVCVACETRFEGEEWRCPHCGWLAPQSQGRIALLRDATGPIDGFRAEYFEELARCEGGNFWFESRNRLIVWALRRYFAHARRFLEIGCGTGFVLSGIRREFPELALWGSEAFSQGLAFAEQRVPGAVLFQMDARHVPFESEFDVIGAFDVLEHIEEDELVLSQMFRAVKPGGGILLTVPQHPFLWGPSDDYALHKRRYRKADLMAKVVRAGFSVVRVTSFVSVLLPLMTFSRMKQAATRSRYDPSAELRLGRFVNMSLRKALDWERIMIERGVSFPVGGSLLVAAVRRCPTPL